MATNVTGSGTIPGSSSESTTTTTTTTGDKKKLFLPANDLDVIQDMIDISADRLEGLRTQCVTSATLTQHEIRSLETKLVRMFSELLLTKARLNERIPASGLTNTTGSELKQWLRVVGLSNESLTVCLQRLNTLEQLMMQSDEQLKQLLSNNPHYKEDEVRRLTKAMQNLRKCKQYLTTQRTTVENESIGNVADIMDNLYWDSWDRHQHPHHHHHHHRGSVGNIGTTTLSSSSPRLQRIIAKQQQQQQQQQQIQNMTVVQQQSPTLTPSPPNSPFSSHSLIFSSGGGGSLNGTPQRLRPSGTPPPIRKHQTQPNNTNFKSMTPTHQPQKGGGGVAGAAANASTVMEHFSTATLPLAKSRSNEAPFYDSAILSITSSPPSLVAISNNTKAINERGPTRAISTNITKAISRTRLHTDPSPDSYSSSASSDIASSLATAEHNNNDNNSNNNINNNNSSSLSLQVPTPRSPCTSANTAATVLSLGMGHKITHRFTKVFKMMSTCDLCQKQMFFGLKCRECKYRCHKDCEANVPPSCCLPSEFVHEFARTLKDQLASASANMTTGSPNMGTPSVGKKHNIVGGLKGADSSSPGSSCNSSSPSSPALFNMAQQATHQQQQFHYQQQQQQQQQQHMANSSNIMSSSGGGSSSNSSNMLSTPSSYYTNKSASQFNFPDVTITSSIASNCPTQILNNGGDMTQILYTSNAHNELENPLELINSISSEAHSETNLPHATNTTSSMSSADKSNSQDTPSKLSSQTNMSTASSFYPRKLSSAGVDRRIPCTSELSDTHKSNDSDKTVSLSGSTSASTDSDRTPRRLDSTEDGDSVNWPRQNSLSLKEWDIPYGDLRLLEQIGRGRFGTVHRALWHGDVAVKLLKEDYLHDEHMLEAFKLEVANFKKTRHENLVLFMGACMNPPYLAIVTSLCKGNTLYTYIHARRDKFTINKTTLVAQQISQGMGYLHARGIHHKDLRTKNIFLENGKVIITDFGLFSSTKLLYCDIGLGVPSSWLCYLSPELMRALQPCKPTEEILPFSKSSDVYSFGTVWYELLCGEFPFKNQPPEAIIWQVGRGMKQTLANLQTSRDVKDILMLCWHYQADDRPDFPKLLTLLERLPKKRLARSPSHPVQLSRSAESVF